MVIELFLDWVQSAPVVKRIEATGALVRAYLNNDISQEEREDAEAALTTLLDDPAPPVRLEMASAFGAFRNAPRHIISALAEDNQDIACLVLSQSPVFVDSELVLYAQRGDEKRQIAIACRPWLSSKLVNDLCGFAERDTVYALLMNPASQFSEAALHEIANRFGTDTEIRNLMVERDDLPAETRLLLVEKLSASLGALVSSNNWMTADRSNEVVAESYDKSSIVFIANLDDHDVARVIRSKIKEGRITPAYLLRSLCMGNIALVAHAISQLSGVRFARVETVLTHDRKSAFKAIYDRAGLPAAAFDVFNFTISAWRQLLKSSSEINRSRLPFLVTREVLSNYTIGESPIMDDLLVLLRKLAAEAARESAIYKAEEIASRSAEEEVIEAELLEHENEEMQDYPRLPDLSEDEQFKELLLVELSAPEIESVGDLEDMKLVDVTAKELLPDADNMYSDIYACIDEEEYSKAA
jgi:uncharacterized protein (DUF2336 family)